MQTFGGLGLTVLLAASIAFPAAAAPSSGTFDHEYRAYGQLLRDHVRDGRVDYVALQRDRAALQDVVRAFGAVEPRDFAGWSREQQIAYWVNAYNVFTLQSIVDHYPIDGGWLSFLRWAPRSSIKQIDGVWDERQWDVAEGRMTLDQIEHETLRVRYDEPRIHFAINCAAKSCPPLRPEPYVASRLERQLVLAARDFLASDEGLQGRRRDDTDVQRPELVRGRLRGAVRAPGRRGIGQGPRGPRGHRQVRPVRGIAPRPERARPIVLSQLRLGPERHAALAAG